MQQVPQQQQQTNNFQGIRNQMIQQQQQQQQQQPRPIMGGNQPLHNPRMPNPRMPMQQQQVPSDYFSLNIKPAYIKTLFC